MCNQYLHLSLCRRLDCENVLGQKRRNRYCPASLRARRLGWCPDGVVAAGEFWHREGALCRPCKLAARDIRIDGANCGLPDNGVEEGEINPRSSSRPVVRRKAKTLFDHVFTMALDTQLKEFERERKPKRKANPMQEIGYDAEDVFFQVESPKPGQAGLFNGKRETDDDNARLYTEVPSMYHGFQTLTITQYDMQNFGERNLEDWDVKMEYE
ncbi:hypothetical protein SUNI508_11237 [Seiridium unicorne]|uniref:Uncharacterized protein n=1 Tax=Seiridium unicorne TaxID=138068 RepID=A0ABR2UID6_9PEZI